MNEHLGVVKCLIEMGMKDERLVEELSKGIRIAIAWAIKNGKLEVLKCLIEIGMKNDKLIEELSSIVEDTLKWAINNRKLELIKCLMETGMKNERLVKRLSRGMVQLKEFIISSNDKRMLAWFSRLDMMRTTHGMSHHVLSDSKDSENGDICPICREELTENISILRCRHSFHEDCIGNWIKARSASRLSTTCAICKSKIDLNKYPWTLDDLFEYNERKCHGCKKDLCNGDLFRVCQNINSLEFFVFCCECASEGKENATQGVIGGANKDLKVLLK